MSFPTPPIDGAGGRLLIRVRKPGVASFHVGVHIPPFAASPESTSVVGSTTTDWAYSAGRGTALSGSSLEPSVGQTAADLIAAIKTLYDSGFSLQPTALYRITPVTINGVATTQAEQVFPVPNVGPIAGSWSDFAAEAGSPSALVTSYYMGRSAGNAADASNPHSGRRFRLALRAIPGRAAGWWIPVTPTGGGYNQPYAESLLGPANLDQTAQDRALVGYLSQQHAIGGFTGQVLAHDGTIPYGQFNLETNTTKAALRALKRDAA
jgi:hypothetical protein